MSAVEKDTTELRLDVLEGADFTVLVLHGDLDATSAPRLREQLDRLIDAGQRQVALDLGAVTFLDSTGVGMLVAALTELRIHGGDLVLACIPERILMLLDLTGLTQVFCLYESTGSVLDGRVLRR